jgi:hypothetical protein
MAVHDDGDGEAIYIGGGFSTAGGVAASRIARWNGQSWSGLGSGISDGVEVRALASVDLGTGPALYAGGWFTTAGGVLTQGLARWQGSAWSKAGGFFGVVSAVVGIEQAGVPALVAGGDFYSGAASPSGDSFIALLVGCEDACPADLDGDGTVGASDLAIILGAWSTSLGDLDGDGVVGASDLATVLASWGVCS